MAALGVLIQARSKTCYIVTTPNISSGVVFGVYDSHGLMPRQEQNPVGVTIILTVEYFGGYDGSRHVWTLNLTSYDWTLTTSGDKTQFLLSSITMGVDGYVWGIFLRLGQLTTSTKTQCA